MLYVSLLGEQVIIDGGAGVRTRSPRTVALVAFLVVLLLGGIALIADAGIRLVRGHRR